jgi:hypothetical protein
MDDRTTPNGKGVSVNPSNGRLSQSRQRGHTLIVRKPLDSVRAATSRYERSIPRGRLRLLDHREGLDFDDDAFGNAADLGGACGGRFFIEELAVCLLNPPKLSKSSRNTVVLRTSSTGPPFGLSDRADVFETLSSLFIDRRIV